MCKVQSSRSYIDKYGLPQTLTELCSHKIVGIMDQTRNAYQKLMLEDCSGSIHEIELEQIAVTCDSLIRAGLVAHSGLGIAALINKNDTLISLFSGLDLVAVLPEYRIRTEHAVYLVSSSRIQTPQKKLFMKFIRDTLLKCLG
jgi:DNA-binding transcriptional LysR family regulator